MHDIICVLLLMSAAIHVHCDSCMALFMCAAVYIYGHSSVLLLMGTTVHVCCRLLAPHLRWLKALPASSLLAWLRKLSCMT